MVQTVLLKSNSELVLNDCNKLVMRWSLFFIFENKSMELEKMRNRASMMSVFCDNTGLEVSAWFRYTEAVSFCVDLEMKMTELLCK